MLDPAVYDRAEEHDRERNPDQRDQDVDRPFGFRVLLRLGDAEREGDRNRDDHELPAPEYERGELVADQPGLASPLHHVETGRHQRATAESKYHRVGV